MQDATAAVSPTAPDRVLGIARSYDVLKRRTAEFNVTMERVDDIAGLPARYVSKLFAPLPVKNFGRTSLGPLLGALGVELVVRVDQGQFDRIKARLRPRASPAFRRKHWHPNSREQLRGNSEWGRVMRARATVLLSPKMRQRIAREAARARWAKVKPAANGSPQPS